MVLLAFFFAYSVVPTTKKYGKSIEKIVISSQKAVV